MELGRGNSCFEMYYKLILLRHTSSNWIAVGPMPWGAVHYWYHTLWHIHSLLPLTPYSIHSGWLCHTRQPSSLSQVLLCSVGMKPVLIQITMNFIFVVKRPLVRAVCRTEVLYLARQGCRGGVLGRRMAEGRQAGWVWMRLGGVNEMPESRTEILESYTHTCTH